MADLLVEGVDRSGGVRRDVVEAEEVCGPGAGTYLEVLAIHHLVRLIISAGQH